MANRLRTEEKVEILGRLPLFENCTGRELGEIAAIMVETAKPAGSFLTREGQDGGIMFVIVEGEAEVLAGEDQPAAARTIGHLRTGDVVGELSLIDGKARSASVRATTPVRLLEIVSDDFYQLVQRSPSFVMSLLKALSIRVREMDLLTS
ncbi:MAG TPA: cyclic nucleotide-binding domain-containing protein [Acidimicrobiales bacterium]|nr:cyclic nucleotide-binding domain-containing protein [Acidimicrobiales bacterium]